MKNKLLICLIMCFTNILCAQNMSYCIANDDGYGIIVTDPSLEKDSAYAGIDFYQSDNRISFESKWTKQNSLKHNLSLPVLDQRWETFSTRYDNATIFDDIMKCNKFKYPIYFSLRIHDIASTNLTEKFKTAQWYHLKLDNCGLYICYEKYYNNCSDKLNDTLTPENYYDRSKQSLWKIHDYDYFYLNKNNKTEFNFPIDTKSCKIINNGCLTLFSAACKNCTLSLTLTPNSTNITNSQTINKEIQGNGVWQTTKIDLKRFTNCFTVTVCATSIENESNFWAFSDVAFLSKNDSCKNHKRSITLDNTDNLICENSNNTNIGFTNTLGIDFSDTKKTIPVSAESSSIFIILTVISVSILILVLIVWVLYKKMNKKNLNCNHDEETVPLLLLNDQYVIIRNGDFNWLPVQSKLFSNYIQYVFTTNPKNNFLETQYSCLPATYLESYEIAQKQENLKKNKYSTIFPYDKNRVVLKKSLGDRDASDYINASYITGLNSDKEYIATQNPFEETGTDFYRMLWQENVEYIVMISSPDDKYYQYWPDVKRYQTYNDIDVFTDNEKFCEFYYHRILTVRRYGQIREVNQLHFVSWSSQETISSHIFVDFINQLLKIPHTNSPVVFHCSAGIGRSATILLCEIVLRTQALSGKIDFFATTKKLREDRVKMVHNLKQYQLAHLIVYECLNYDNKITEVRNDFSTEISRICEGNNIKKTWSEYLENTKWLHEAMSPYQICDAYPKNNRYNNSDLLPVEHSRVALKYKKPDYIHAMYVCDYYQEKNYIVAQQPLPNTSSNFWIMALQNNVKIILNLNETELSFRGDINFFPTDRHKSKTIEGNIVIKFVSEDKHFNYHKLELTVLTSDKSEKNVTLINVKNWPKLKTFPESTDVITDIWEVTTNYQNDTPILICCDDGITSSSLVACFFYMAKKMLCQQQCDVVGAVRAVRRTHSNFIKFEQFAFLYHCALAFFQNCYKLYVN